MQCMKRMALCTCFQKNTLNLLGAFVAAPFSYKGEMLMLNFKSILLYFNVQKHTNIYTDICYNYKAYSLGHLITFFLHFP